MTRSLLLLVFFISCFSIKSESHPSDLDPIKVLPSETKITFDFSEQRPLNLLPTRMQTQICRTSDAEIYIAHKSSIHDRIFSRPLLFTFRRPGQEVIKSYRDALFFGQPEWEFLSILSNHSDILRFDIAFARGSKKVSRIGELKQLLQQCGGQLEIPRPQTM